MKLDDLVPFERVLEESLRDPEFRVEWERLAPARTVANRLIAYRVDNGLTQTALGRRLGMSQPAIARLEAADHLPTLETLFKLSEALDLEISVTMIPACRRDEAPPIRSERTTERVSTAGGSSLTIAIR